MAVLEDAEGKGRGRLENATKSSPALQRLKESRGQAAGCLLQPLLRMGEAPTIAAGRERRRAHRRILPRPCGLARYLWRTARSCRVAAKDIRIGRKRVARLMAKAGLVGVSQRRFVTTTNQSRWPPGARSGGTQLRRKSAGSAVGGGYHRRSSRRPVVLSQGPPASSSLLRRPTSGSF